MNVNKYRIFFFCFLWVGCSGWAFSQNDKIIEALQVNYTSCKTDTGKVNILLQIANLTKDNDSSILYSRNALNISLKNNFITGIALSYKKLGNCYLNKNDHTKAIEYFTSAIKYFDETGDKSGIGKCYYNIGLIYYNQSNFAKALEYKLKALKLFEEISDKELIARSYTDIGDIYY